MGHVDLHAVRTCLFHPTRCFSKGFDNLLNLFLGEFFRHLLSDRAGDGRWSHNGRPGDGGRGLATRMIDLNHDLSALSMDGLYQLFKMGGCV